MKHRRDEHGAALVEMILVLIFAFIPLVWGLITFGYVFGVRENMIHSAQDALRVAIIDKGQASTDATAECDIINTVRLRMQAMVGSTHNQPDSQTTGECGQTSTSGGALDVSTNYSGSAFPTCKDSSGNDISGSECATVTVYYNYGNYPVLPSAPGIYDIIPSRLSISVTERIG